MHLKLKDCFTKKNDSLIYLSINPLIICLTESDTGTSASIIHVFPISQINCFIKWGNDRFPNVIAFVEILMAGYWKVWGKLAIKQRKLSYEKQGN